jgi:hypothetical protein
MEILKVSCPLLIKNKKKKQVLIFKSLENKIVVGIDFLLILFLRKNKVVVFLKQ